MKRKQTDLFSFLLNAGVPQSPMDLNVTSIGYSTISVKWKPNFDGGWPQAFWVSLDGYTGKETNQTHFTFTSKYFFF